MDCCIASIAMESHALLPHRDRDFEKISKIISLQNEIFSIFFMQRWGLFLSRSLTLACNRIDFPGPFQYHAPSMNWIQGYHKINNLALMAPWRRVISSAFRRVA